MIHKLGLGILFCLILLAIPITSYADDTVCIIGIQGDVFIRNNKQSNWEIAKNKNILTRNCELKTAQNSKADLLYQEQTCSITENCIVLISKVIDGLKLKKNMKLNNSKLSIKKITDDKNEFTIKVPTAVVGVRGDNIAKEKFTLEFDESEDTSTNIKKNATSDTETKSKNENCSNDEKK